MKSNRYKRLLYRTIASLYRTVGGKIRSLAAEYMCDDPMTSVKPDWRVVEYSFAVTQLPHNSSIILEIGCTDSNNPLVAIASRLGHYIVGVDLRPYYWKLANFHFIQGNASSLPFVDKSVDVVLCISAMEHFGLAGRYGIEESDLEQDRRAFEEMLRVIRPSGRVVLTVPFGKPKVVVPYHRIYGKQSLSDLVHGSEIEVEEYWIRDENGYPMKVDKEVAETYGSEDGMIFGLAALVVRKQCP